MRSRKTNMLEAFRASEDSPALPPQAVSREVGRALSAPPPAPRAPAAAPGRPARAPGAERRPVFLVLTMSILALLGGAFWLGRLSARAELASAEGFPGAPFSAGEERWAYPAAAGLGSAPEATAPLPPSAGETRAAEPELDAEGRTADDRKFYDKKNRFTVRAIYYANTAKGWRRALEAYRYLRGQGLPAIAPIDQGDILVLCIGAEPVREGALAEFQARLRALSGPPPLNEPGAFAGAYFVNIDDLVDRP